MISLREPSENAVVLQRIAALQADRSPAWGKMNCAQMLAHCRKPFLVASGELSMKRGLIGRLLGGMAKKKFVVGDSPFGKNSPTDPTFRVQDERDFGREQTGLVELVKGFGQTGAQTREAHPFFGEMSPAEWDRLMWKHLDHHLRQFGV